MSAERERRPGSNGTALGNTKSNLSDRQNSNISETAQLSGGSASALDYALEYIGRNWAPVPIPVGAKAPRIRNWPNLRVTKDNAARYFNGACNVGIILGKASGGLVDTDLDCVEALEYASTLLPPTAAIFGRASKPKSHRLYRVVGLATSLIFKDPITNSTLVELRGDGGRQTVFPPSTHPTGERVEWEADGDPPIIDYDVLQKAVALLAARCLVARYLPAVSDGTSLLKALRTADRRISDQLRKWLGLPRYSAARIGGEFSKVASRTQDTRFFANFGPRPDHILASREIPRLCDGLLLSFARHDLNDCVSELKKKQAPGRANLLFRKSIRLGILIARGHIEPTQVADALFEACECNGLVDKNGERDVRRQIEKGFTYGADKAREVT